MTGFEGQGGHEGGQWSCAEVEAALVVCTLNESLGAVSEEEEEYSAGANGYAPSLAIEVSAPSESAISLINSVTVTGGGASGGATTSQSTPVGTGPQSFEITEFSMEVNNAKGEPEQQAGGHPWQVTTSLAFPWMYEPANPQHVRFMQVENVKKISVELPIGMVGNLLSTERCTQVQLFHGQCPRGSRVGTLAIAAGKFETADYHTTTQGNPSPVFNVVSEPGYPAVLGFTFASQTVYLYATVVHSASGNRVRLTTVGVPPVLETGDVMLTLWGEPGVFDETGSSAALITDPVDCSAASDEARVEVETWESPGQVKTQATTPFHRISGCTALQAAFTPSLSFSPLTGVEGATRADAPSGFQGTVSVPQTTAFEEVAVPEMRDISATLPAGVSISPAAAQGLEGCRERGSEGINLGTNSIGPGGRDEGNPEATELGAGHAGGNSSLYDDNQYHTAPGHCPAASTIGSVEVFTPLLENRCGEEPLPACDVGESPAPLQGHVYLAQPRCGGQDQPECTAGDADDGMLFAGFVELSGNGVLIKEPTSISVDQITGRVTVHLNEASDFPFSELKLRVHGGQRAVLATPQVCGVATSTASFTSWSSSEPFAPTPTAFTVDADGAGGICPTRWPFTPGFTSGSVSTAAAGSTSFTTTLTRQDREQNVTGLSVTPPLGLLAMLSNVTPCPESQAATGECPGSSLIGHDTAGAGSGSEPFYVSGRVYLTGPYKGAPFGLDVVTPAVAGPFNLGNIVVRATINVNPSTAAVTITSDPIPQSRLGVPLRLKALNVTIDKEHFVLNPTNCSQQEVKGVATGDRGATAALSTPFAVTGCAGLGFSPVLKVSTPGKASKKNGAGLSVTFTATSGQANIEKVKVDVPKQLPSRLATLQKACIDTVFNANPAGCPAASVVGSAVLHTPILKSAMTGPIYLVSHGGAAFPDLVFVLQAEGITIELDGNTNIKHGITSETFRAVPDAPFTSFTATFPQGPHSILATYLPARAKYSLCGQKLAMPASITGQNNAVITRTTKLTVTGCSKPKPKPHRPKPRK